MSRFKLISFYFWFLEASSYFLLPDNPVHEYLLYISRTIVNLFIHHLVIVDRIIWVMVFFSLDYLRLSDVERWGFEADAAANLQNQLPRLAPVFQLAPHFKYDVWVSFRRLASPFNVWCYPYRNSITSRERKHEVESGLASTGVNHHLWDHKHCLERIQHCR